MVTLHSNEDTSIPSKECYIKACLWELRVKDMHESTEISLKKKKRQWEH